MPLQPFKTSNLLTMGVELELQLISLSNFDLTAASPDILELLGTIVFSRQFYARNHREYVRNSDRCA